MSINAGKVSHHVLTLKDGRRLGYSEINPSGAASIVYLHGNPGSRTELIRDDYIDAFVKNGYRIITVDRPGYGDSDLPLKKGHDAFVDDLEQLFDHLKLEKAVVVGFSRGTLPALALGALLPHRVEVIGMLGATGLPDDARLMDDLSATAKLILSLVKYAPFAARRIVRFGAWLDHQFPASAVQRMKQIVPSKADGRVMDADGPSWIKAHAVGMARDPGYAVDDWRAWLVEPLGFRAQDVAVPVVLWTGAEDMTCPPSNAIRIKERVPGASIEIVEGLGHMHTPHFLIQFMSAVLHTR